MHPTAASPKQANIRAQRSCLVHGSQRHAGDASFRPAGELRCCLVKESPLPDTATTGLDWGDTFRK